MKTFSILALALGALSVLPLFANDTPGRPETEPIPITATQFLNGEHEQEFVRMEGTIVDLVRDEIDSDFRFFIIDSENETVYAPSQHITEDDAVLKSLVGAKVSVCGTSDRLTTPDFPRRQMRRNLYIWRLSDITVLEPAPKDPFSVPELEDLANVRPADIPRIGRRRVRGKVLAVWGRNKALIEPPDRLPMRIELSDVPLPEVGSFVEAVGVPETDIYRINLTRAIWRTARSFPLPGQPVTDVRAKTILTDPAGKTGFKFEFHGKVVRLSGIIRSLPQGEGVRFYLEDGSYLIPVDATSSPQTLRTLDVGCTVSVTGLCVMNVENWSPARPFPRIDGIVLVPRGESDITVLSRPPWWTPGRIWGVVGVLFATLLGFVIWNRSLTILANRRGRELMREQIGRVRADLKTEERTRLAVELHDTLAQNLTGVSMEIEAANGLKGTPDMEPHLDFAAKALKSCRDELRNCLWDLRSQALEEKDMNTAILRTLQPHVNDSRVAVRFNVPRTKVSDNTAHALLRVIRELVVNAIRHGNAPTVKVAGSLDPEALRCSVTDNGSGFDPETAPGVLQGHFGIQGMRERIEELGGEFTLESAPGKGTKATIVIPAPQML